jgi:hypothetical protein
VEPELDPVDVCAGTLEQALRREIATLGDNLDGLLA